MVKAPIAVAASFILLGALSLARPSPAFAFGSRPSRACAPYASDMSVPGLWLGHFSGGRLDWAPGRGRFVDWRDDYSCFTTAAACAAWQRSRLREFGAVEGYRTCLPLRGGGVPIESAEPVITAKY
jgi:hypothetical protein